MLPFLKRKQAAGIAMEYRKPDEDKQPDEDGDAGISACAADLIKAIHAQDEKGVAEALRAAFEILDSEPHVEGEHLNEELE